jgi:hypothetical protein
MRSDGHERFAGSRRRAQDHIRARDNADQRFFLRWIQRQTVGGRPRGECVEDRVCARPAGCSRLRDAVDQTRMLVAGRRAGND